jgi:hypothetical protein
MTAKHTNSTAGYLLIQLWDLHQRNHQPSTDFAEDDFMVTLMEAAGAAADMVDCMIDWPNFSCGVFDYEYADLNCDGSLAKTIWDGHIMAERSLEDVVSTWISDSDIPQKPLQKDHTTQELLHWMGRSYQIPIDQPEVAGKVFSTLHESGAANLKIREIENEQNAMVREGLSGANDHRLAEWEQATGIVTKNHFFLQQYQAH